MKIGKTVSLFSFRIIDNCLTVPFCNSSSTVLRCKQIEMIWKSSLFRYLKCDLQFSRQKSFTRPLRVLFYGSDNFSLSTLQVLYEERWLWENYLYPLVLTDPCLIFRKLDRGLSKLSVVTGIKRPPNVVHAYSQKENIPFFGWPTGNESGEYDIGVVVSFSHLIPQRIIESFPLWVEWKNFFSIFYW